MRNTLDEISMTINGASIDEIERLERIAEGLRKQKHSGLPGNCTLQTNYKQAIEETLEAIKRLARKIPKEG